MFGPIHQLPQTTSWLFVFLGTKAVYFYVHYKARVHIAPQRKTADKFVLYMWVLSMLVNMRDNLRNNTCYQEFSLIVTMNFISSYITPAPTHYYHDSANVNQSN